MHVLERAQALTEELVALRRDFHRHPETGFEVSRTAEIVAGRLKSSGVEVRRNVGKSGVVGMLKATRSSRTIAFRAELDALDMDEQSDLPFKSVHPGKAHACGHDAHMAMLLGGAKLLAPNRESLRQNVRLFFQPSEEKLPGGAQAMIEDGALDGVDECFGVHVTPRVRVPLWPATTSAPCWKKPREA